MTVGCDQSVSDQKSAPRNSCPLHRRFAWIPHLVNAEDVANGIAIAIEHHRRHPLLLLEQSHLLGQSADLVLEPARISREQSREQAVHQNQCGDSQEQDQDCLNEPLPGAAYRLFLRRHGFQRHSIFRDRFREDSARLFLTRNFGNYRADAAFLGLWSRGWKWQATVQRSVYGRIGPQRTAYRTPGLDTLVGLIFASDSQYYLGEVLAFAEQTVSFANLMHGENLPDIRPEAAFANPGGKLVPGTLHDCGLGGEIGKPEPVHAGAFCVENSGIELGRPAGRTSVANHATKIPQAANALRRMLAPKHFENGVHAFSASELANRLLVVVLFVVDPMLQPNLACPRQFFIG